MNNNDEQKKFEEEKEKLEKEKRALEEERKELEREKEEQQQINNVREYKQWYNSLSYNERFEEDKKNAERRKKEQEKEATEGKACSPILLFICAIFAVIIILVIVFK